MIRAAVVVASVVLSSVSFAQEGRADARRFPAQRFAVAAPGEGWTVLDGKDTPAGYQVAVPLTTSGGLVAASILSGPTPGSATAEASRDAALATLDSREGYLSHELIDDVEVGGLVASGADVAWQPPGRPEFVIRMRYVVGGGRTYLLQVHAPKDDWAKHTDAFDRFFDSFAIIEPSEDEIGMQSIAELASRCGSELDWAADWDEAAARAKQEGRHVLVVLRSYRGFDLPDTTKLVTFMDEDIIALVRERLVPVRLTASDASPLRDPDVYGLSGSTFGSAFILVRPDGEVIADTPHYDPPAVHLWLRTELERAPEREPERPEDPIAAARLALDRGELELAEAALDRSGNEVAEVYVLRARLAQMRNDGELALGMIVNAINLDIAVAKSLGPDAAMILLKSGEPAAEARAILMAALSDSKGPHFPEALLVESYLDQREYGLDAARKTRQRLVRDFPESRWAWLAAAYIQLEPVMKLASDGELKMQWPRPEVLALAAEAPSQPVPASAARRAEAEALAWLLSHQRDDGSWPSLNELDRPDDEAPDHISTAVDALATRALLARGDRYREQAERGIAFLLGADGMRRADPPPVVYMDYTAWSAWAQLELIADALGAEAGDAEELRAWGERLVQDLASRVRANGGWSYYVSGDMAGQNKVEQSISFTTAAVVIGLIRARDAGVTVPDGMIDGALDCLEEMRGDDGLFAYMLQFPNGVQSRSAAPGSAGRGPVCELALAMGGRSGPDEVRAALDLFHQNAQYLAAEVGKSLMHAGSDGQGCHYPFFDYLMAARAAESLSPRDAREHRARMLDVVLQARLADGSFQDTPIIGPSFGTAAALMTLAAMGGD